MNPRYERGQHIAANLRVVKGVGGRYAYVQSQSKDKVWYKVTEDGICECPDFQTRGVPCKHMYAVILKEVEA